MPEDAASAAEAFLQRFHARIERATPRAFGAMAHDGPDGYTRLCEQVPLDGAPPRVLDIGCGDGELLARVHRRRPDAVLIGIDISADEIARAAARLPASAQLHCQRAQALSPPDASVDLVLSHMVLMLVADIEQVVLQLRRVLRSGGRLAAAVGTGLADTPAARVYREEIDTAHAAEPHARLSFGDRRTRSAGGWRELLREGFDAPQWTAFSATTSGDAQAMWREAQLAYDVHLFSTAQQQRLRERMLDRWTDLHSSHALELRWQLALLTSVRRA